MQAQALADIDAAQTKEALYEVHVKYLGRKGELTLLMRGIKDLPKEEKPEMGKLVNEVKVALEAAFEKKGASLEREEVERSLRDSWIDVTAPGTEYKTGRVHVLNQVQREIEEIFSAMGFEIQDGPEVESEYYNFEGLNIPEHHPARDMQDTFFLKRKADPQHGRLVLRTHTSPVQVRTLEKYGAPVRMIVPGRVFRNEAIDASHEHTFNQVEGMMIDKDISIAHLKGVMETFLTRLFRRETKVRFRPGYFPFVEPGLELDMSCALCGGDGCRVCKHTGWIEFMGAGMTHPNVLRAGGVDPNVYQGWAFGFGLTRLAMMRYAISDIRLFAGGDIRFLEQF